MILLQIMPIFMIVIFIDRSLFNNLFLRINTLLRNNGQVIDWLNDTVEVHVILYTISDFISSCIQLYLTYQYCEKTRSDSIMVDDEKNSQS